MPIRGKDGSDYNSANEVIRADNRWEQQQKQNELLKEQNRIAQQQMQMQQQALQQQMQLQQQEMQFREEQERQRIEEQKRAETERLHNQLRLYCNSKGLDYDYMLNYWIYKYSIEENTKEIDYKINELEDILKIFNIKEELRTEEERLKPIRRKMWLLAAILTFLSMILFYIVLTLYFYEKIILGIIIGILGVILLIKPWKYYIKISKGGDLSKKFNLRKALFQYRDILNSAGALEENKKNLDDLKMQKETIINTIKDNQKEFDDFRKNHYNKEIELLFKDLSISFNKISKDEIKKEGTIADYKEFFEDKMLEM